MTNKEYIELLKQEENNTKNMDILKTLEIKNITADKLQHIINTLEDIIQNDQVLEVFGFRMGKLMGILRFIAQHPRQSKELCEAIGLTTAYIDIHREVAGNLPYWDKTLRRIKDDSRKTKIKQYKELLKITALTLGIVVTDDDLEDINQQHWDEMSKMLLERAKLREEFMLNEPEDISYEE